MNQSRLPPGQALNSGFPTLDLGLRPPWREGDRLAVTGLVEQSITWTLDELKAVARQSQTSDFHCVTGWSHFGLNWTGLPATKLAEIVKPKRDTRFVIAYCADGYTTNLPIEDFLRPTTFIATALDDAEIGPNHGGPIRLLVPHLYGWKSAKFLRRLDLTRGDAPGYWEVRGYHNYGDPWQQQRYSED